MESRSASARWGIYVYFGNSFTGAPRVATSLAEAMTDFGIRPVVFTQKESELTSSLDGTCHVEIVPLHHSLHQRGGAALHESFIRRLSALWHALRHNFRIYRALRRLQADGLWVRNVRGVLICGLAARLRRIPLVWDIGMEKPSNSFALGVLYNFAFAISTTVVAEGECVFDFVFSDSQRRVFGRKMRVIQSGIPPERVDEILAAKKRRQASDNLRLLCVATLCQRKNQMLLLRAIASLEASTVSVSFVGDDTYESAYADELADYVDRNKLTEQVSFLGWRTDIPDLLAAHDVFVLTSRNEGVPYSVIEAMYAGLPVIATSVGGLPDVVTDGVTGLLTPSDDHEALARQISKVCNSHVREELQKRAYEYVLANHTRESWARSYAELLNRLTRKQGNVQVTNV